jgi:transcriptional regulator
VYVPPHAREERLDVLHTAIADIGFGTLVTVDDGAPVVTHLPMMLSPEGAGAVVIGHLSRANPQWRTTNPSALATWVGPSFYVSPSWYAQKRLDGKVVPTYNYIAVEVRGTIAFFEEPDRLRALVDTLTAKHEAGRPAPWSSADAPRAYIDAQLRGIVGFTLTVASITGAWKLNRNKNHADRSGVADGIASAADARVRELAQRVRRGT